MKIDWKRLKNKIKFYLGLKCVVQYGDRWVVTCREGLVFRAVLDAHWRGGYWWSAEYYQHWTLFTTQHEAQKALDKLTEKQKACRDRKKLKTKFTI